MFLRDRVTSGQRIIQTANSKNSQHPRHQIWPQDWNNAECITHKTSKGYYPLPIKKCHVSFEIVEVLNRLCKFIFQLSQKWFIQYDIHLLRTQTHVNYRLLFTHYFFPSPSQMTTLCNSTAAPPYDVSYLISCPWNHGSQVQFNSIYLYFRRSYIQDMENVMFIILRITKHTFTKKISNYNSNTHSNSKYCCKYLQICVIVSDKNKSFGY
jgi:hypothetical protein